MHSFNYCNISVCKLYILFIDFMDILDINSKDEIYFVTK